MANRERCRTESMSTFGRASHTIFWVAIAWLFIAALLAFQFWPHLPASASGWTAFIAFGPPLYVLAEGAAEWAWSSRAGRAISNHPSSAFRIFLGVAIGLVVSGAIWGGLWLFNMA